MERILPHGIKLNIISGVFTNKEKGIPGRIVDEFEFYYNLKKTEEQDFRVAKHALKNRSFLGIYGYYRRFTRGFEDL